MDAESGSACPADSVYLCCGVENAFEQGYQAVPGNLDADAEQDEGYDAQDSVRRRRRNVPRDSVRVRIAEVDGEAERQDGEEQPGVGEQVVPDGPLRGVRREGEHDHDAAGAGGDGKGEGVEDLLAQVVGKVADRYLRGGLHLFRAEFVGLLIEIGRASCRERV